MTKLKHSRREQLIEDGRGMLIRITGARFVDKVNHRIAKNKIRSSEDTPVNINRRLICFIGIDDDGYVREYTPDGKCLEYNEKQQYASGFAQDKSNFNLKIRE